MEYLDLVDRMGNPLGKAVSRADAHRKGLCHRTAHVWIARRRGGTVELLLQKRSMQKDAYPGCYDISSAGHIPYGCDYVESALRELSEELGISADADELIDIGMRYVEYDGNFGGRPFHDREVAKVFLLWRDLDPTALTLQKEEVEAVEYMPFDTCVDAALHNTPANCIYPEELTLLRRAFGNSI